jgi:ribonucleoside-triphosphate reductase
MKNEELRIQNEKCSPAAASNKASSGRCGKRCEVWSRVCGYFRPVANWNEGKKEEFKERKAFLMQNEKCKMKNEASEAGANLEVFR